MATLTSDGLREGLRATIFSGGSPPACSIPARKRPITARTVGATTRMEHWGMAIVWRTASSRAPWQGTSGLRRLMQAGSTPAERLMLIKPTVGDETGAASWAMAPEPTDILQRRWQ